MDLLTIVRSHLYPAVVTVTVSIPPAAAAGGIDASSGAVTPSNARPTHAVSLWMQPIRLTIHPSSCMLVKVKDVPFAVQKEPDPMRPDRQRTPPLIAIVATEGTIYLPQRSDSTVVVTPSGWVLTYPTYTLRWDRYEA